MKPNSQIKELFIGTLFLMALVSMASEAQESSTQFEGIRCQSTNQTKVLDIGQDGVWFIDETEGAQRKIASVEQVRTQWVGKGFSKTLYRDGMKHHISIAHVGQFSPLNDSLTILSPEGHKMTYPLECEFDG